MNENEIRTILQRELNYYIFYGIIGLTLFYLMFIAK